MKEKACKKQHLVPLKIHVFFTHPFHELSYLAIKGVVGHITMLENQSLGNKYENNLILVYKITVTTKLPQSFKPHSQTHAIIVHILPILLQNLTFDRLYKYFQFFFRRMGYILSKVHLYSKNVFCKIISFYILLTLVWRLLWYNLGLPTYE